MTSPSEYTRDVAELERAALVRRGLCPDCGGLWPDHCSCPDRDDDVQARDEAGTRVGDD